MVGRRGSMTDDIRAIVFLGSIMQDRTTNRITSMLSACALAAFVGCGTTQLTNTSRSASEELLLSKAIDQSVASLDLGILAGQRVFLDTANMGDVTFDSYLTGALRQHLLASGARLAPEADQADIVVEARAGAVSTTKHESLVGIPQTTVPAMLFGAPATLPEIAILKRVIHIGVAKVGVFAYRVDTGGGVWQSGMAENHSTSENRWYLGMGPYQTGDVIVDGQRRGANASRPRPCLSIVELPMLTGEMPPPPDPTEPLSGQVREPADGDADDERGESAEDAEELPPGTPGETPLPEHWQWVSPVVISTERESISARDR